MSDYIIRKAHQADLDAVKRLADTHRDELGFVLRPALARSIEREEVLLAENHVRAIGFVEYHHRQDDQTTLYHIAVAPTHRRMGIGEALIGSLADEARRLGKSIIQLKCPADLEARSFYESVGFQPVRREAGKERVLVVFTLDV